MKLLNVVQPNVALFGKKDYQQLMVLSNMVRQFAMPIEILSWRDRSSSRWSGAVISQWLPQRRRTSGSTAKAKAPYTSSGISSMPALGPSPNWSERPWTFFGAQLGTGLHFRAPARGSAAPAATDDPLVVLAAAKLGRTRLIDNLEI